MPLAPPDPPPYRSMALDRFGCTDPYGTRTSTACTMSPCRPFAALLLLALLAGCDSLLAPQARRALSIRVDPPSLVLTNRTAHPLYLLAFEEQTAMLALWGPCTEPQQPCPSVPSSGTTVLPFDRIAGYREGEPQTALVFWWHLVPAPGGGLRPDSVRTVAVRLP
jgi:hypothetical protein